MGGLGPEARPPSLPSPFAFAVAPQSGPSPPNSSRGFRRLGFFRSSSLFVFDMLVFVPSFFSFYVTLACLFGAVPFFLLLALPSLAPPTEIPFSHSPGFAVFP